ncbi:hypothetical protein ACFE04_006130 [Oxalis oulophora]
MSLTLPESSSQASLCRYFHTSFPKYVLTFLVLQVVLVSPIHQSSPFLSYKSSWFLQFISPHLSCLTSRLGFSNSSGTEKSRMGDSQIRNHFSYTHRPVSYVCYKLRHSRNWVFFNLVFVFLAFPAAAFFVLKGVFSGFGDIDVVDFWKWLELGLESVCLNGIGLDDCGVGSLWRRCRNVKKLKLTNCESLGDGGSSFINCLQGLEELELRTCRTIVDAVMLKLTDNAINLRSLLVYDGGNRDSILHFINNCPCDLQKLDLSCLVTGDGLKSLGIAMNSGLRESALINCDVVERESGLLATLGQYFKHLRTLDLSYNEMLVDKEFISMIVSCNCLTELKIRGCKRLTNMAAISIFKSCKNLELIDIMYCSGIEVDAVETLVLNSRQLRQLKVEDSKISDNARKWAS